MIWFLRYLRGYLLIEFSGEYSEQLLNLTARNRIPIWNLHCKKGKITGYITLDGYKKLRIIRRGTKIKPRIVKKYGLPFKTTRYKKRYGILAGAAIFLLILKVMSLFVWEIDVVGNEKIPKSKIINSCSKIGISVGSKISSVDTVNDAQRLILTQDGISWASLNVEGCRVTVNVSELNGKQKEERPPSNLKASCDGIIEKIDLTGGNAIVKIGDTVAKGDLLVSGVFENLDSTFFTRSIGTVTAKTVRQYSANKEYISREKVYTNRTYSRKVLTFFHVRVPLYLGSIKAKCDYKTEEYPLRLFGSCLPIGITEKSGTEYEYKNVKRDEKEIEKLLERTVEKQIKSEVKGEYETLKSEFIKDDKGITYIKEITAHENIAVNEDIIINTKG